MSRRASALRPGSASSSAASAAACADSEGGGEPGELEEPPKQRRSGTMTWKWPESGPTCRRHCQVAMGPKPWIRSSGGRRGSPGGAQ
uniref:Uncharacterized protein n=1 Tax=Arundo donax TaxID=35708 RepID=A0A0A9HG16_ARUDO